MLSRFPIKTHQLAFLVHLDDERRLARAATAAGLTQPAASKLLRQIEEILDVKLFERHARGVAPTRYGEILVRHARSALSEIGLAREELAALKAGRTGKAAVGTIVEPAANLVPAAIATLKQRYPGTLVRVEIDASRQLVQRLLQGHLDMVVARLLDAESAEELVYEPLALDEPHAVIASARHPLAGRAHLRLQDLIDQPWIMPPPGSLVRDKLAAMLLHEGLPQPGDIVETSSLPMITALLEQGRMIVALPEVSVASYCKAGILKVLMTDLPVGIGGYGLITRRSHESSPGACLMLSTLREVAAHLYPGCGRTQTARRA
ncbi:MAG TPA: LysR substrate-binding domain-containing protein [Steroidobacteraceae bacterium]|nr:LysR substrate-binding domain-containing protein [Steroidobacteraceae bacterium]